MPSLPWTLCALTLLTPGATPAAPEPRTAPWAAPLQQPKARHAGALERSTESAKPPPDAAPRTDLESSLDRDELGLDDNLVLMVLVRRTNDERPFRLELAATQDFELVGQSADAGGHRFVLRPQRVGVLAVPAPRLLFTEPRLTLDAGGEAPGGAQPQPLTVRVVPGSLGRSPKSPRTILGATNEVDLLDCVGTPLPPAIGAPPLFLRAFVDKTRAYVGEQVTLGVYLYARVDLAGVDGFQLRPTGGFVLEDLFRPAQLEGEIRFVEHLPYRVFLLRKTALFPYRTGELALGTTTATPTPPNGEPSQWHSKLELPLPTVQVLPLAEPAPAVGHWRVAVAAVPEAHVLRVTLEGTGDLHGTPDPTLPPIDGLELGPPQVRGETVLVEGGRFGGRRIVDYPYFAKAPGRHQIPEVAFAYFEPGTGSLQTARSQPFSLMEQEARNRPVASPVAEPAPAGRGDLVVALDVSTSMRALDWKPRDRMSVAKDFVRKLLQSRPDDRVGLVLFSGEAVGRVPLTLDRARVLAALAEVQPGQLPDGTTLGDATITALNVLCQSSPDAEEGAANRALGACRRTTRQRELVLVTDGDDNAGRFPPADPAELASRLRVRLSTVQVGRGGKVPFPAEKEGETEREVEIPVNPELLESLARRTGGSFARLVKERDEDQAVRALARRPAAGPAGPQDDPAQWATDVRLLQAARRAERAQAQQRDQARALTPTP